MKDSSDILSEFLVLRIQSGEKRALELLVRQWNRKIYRRAIRLTGDTEAARDVCQEVWIAAMKGIRTLKDPSKFSGWIFRIVGNKSADWIRKRQSARRLRESLEDSESHAFASEDPVPGRIERLRRKLRLLPSEQRTILTLFYLEELPVREIAAIFDIPEGTVKSRLYHARGALKDALEE